MIKTTRRSFLYLVSLLILLATKPAAGMVSDTLAIVAGSVKITGKLITPHETGRNKVFVNVTVPHPVSGEHVKQKAFVDESGNFSLDIDVETSVALVGLYTSLNLENTLLLKVKNGEITHIDIFYNPDNQIEKITVKPANLTQAEMINSLGLVSKMIEYRSGRAPEPLYNKGHDYFLNHAKNILAERLQVLNNDSDLSAELKEVLTKDFQLVLYVSFVFDYEEYMLLNYRNINQGKNDKPTLKKADRSYYRFLKDFHLNDPQYLFAFTFPEFQNKILQNEILKLPEIGEKDIPSWLASVKLILADLVGFDDGPYYDILAANAYARQLNGIAKPLSEKQKAHIHDYWKETAIAKILFRKNQQVVELEKYKAPAKINDISSVQDSKVIKTILSKYKNQVVFIDLWATWCAPCLDAMKEFRAAKNELKDKDVAFIYLTNSSSPRKLWESDQHEN